MADGFVQQDAGPAVAQDHGHLASRRGAGFEVDQCCVHGLVHIGLGDGLAEVAEVVAAAAASGADFAATMLLGDDSEGQADQGAHVGGHRAVRAGDHDDVVFTAEAGHDLHDAGVLGTGATLDVFEEGDLGGAVQRRDGVEGRVEGATGGDAGLTHLDLAALASGGDGAHGAGGIEQGRFRDVVGVGEGGFLAGDGAHAHALVDAEAAGLDDALLQAPAFAARVLEVEVSIVDPVVGDDPQGFEQGGLVQLVRRKQQLTGSLEAGDGGVNGDHGRIVGMVAISRRHHGHRLRFGRPRPARTRLCAAGR